MHNADSFQPSFNKSGPGSQPDQPTSPASAFQLDSEWAIRAELSTNPTVGFNLLYRRYYAPLCSHAVRLVYARDVAEDLVTELFIRLWQRHDYLTITGSFRAYLFSAIRNRAINYLRWEQGHTEQLDEGNDSQRADLLADDPLAFEELAEQVNRVVGSLPPQCRSVFLLSRFEGKKNREIAEELHISPKTVEGHLTKALAQVRVALRHYWCLLFPLLWL